ncbi:hypothetical protein [Nocardia farcinica]|uniref:hypothetical protein n=1 Tax=Nocardia farcinica TaxID=37329 RepID=UPI0034DB165B
MNGTSVLQAVVAGLVVAAVTGVFKLLAPKVSAAWAGWRQRRAAEMKERRDRREWEKQEHARAAKIAAAVAAGKPVLINRRGDQPVEDAYSDGSVAYFFRGDWEGYRAAMRSGSYDPRRTFPFDPPPID